MICLRTSAPLRLWRSVIPALLLLIVLVLSSPTPSVDSAAVGVQGAGGNSSCMKQYFQMSGIHLDIINTLNLEKKMADVGLDMPRIRTGQDNGSLLRVLKYPNLVQAVERCASGNLYYCKHYPPCNNGGSCHLDLASATYGCVCSAGYTGPSCASSLTAVATVSSHDDYERSCMMAYFHMIGINSTIVRKYGLENGLAKAGLDGEKIVDKAYSKELKDAVHGTTLDDQLRECVGGQRFNCRMFPPCLHNASCALNRTTLKYYCRCQAGFSGFSCAQDIDECSARRSPCNGTLTCQNTLGSYFCKSEDTDECAAGHHSCKPDQTCKNTIGSYTCADMAESIGDLLDSIEVKVNRRKNRKPKTRPDGIVSEQARRSRKRFRKLLQRLHSISESMRRIPGVDPNATDARGTGAPPSTSRQSTPGIPAM